MDKQINFVVKFWHILVMIASFIFSLGLVYGVGSYRLDSAEKRITDLETWKEKRVELLNNVEKDISGMKAKIDLIYDEVIKNK